MYTQTIVRCIFLLFIICLAAYFLVVNKTKTTEQFVQQETENKLPKNKEELAGIIIKIYAEIYQNDPVLSNPSKKAVDFYVDYAMQRDLTREDLKQVISGSSTALERTFQQNSSKPAVIKDVYGTEDEVTSIYNKVLFRNPDETELYNFSKMLKEGSENKSFNMDKLEQILYASEEYKRLQKTQVNTVYSNLMGGVTERQLYMIIDKVYSDVTKGNEPLDPETRTFLRRKLLSFNLDEAKFKLFVQAYVTGKPFTEVKMETSPINNQKQQSNQGSDKKEILNKENFKQEVLREVLSEIRKDLANTPKETPPNQLSQVVAPNKQVIEVLLKTASDSERENQRGGSYLDSQDVLERIKEDAKCVFDKNAKDNYWSGAVDNRLSKLQDERNTEELRSICIRNKKFLGIDEDMVLDASQKWSVPQRHPPVCLLSKNAYQPMIEQTALIGTLLEEAKNTEVGSILPEKVPR